jgi:adenine-specific DNA-methyltransferase
VDLFTWSGALAHAVLLSNAASRCSRRFISIQLPAAIKSDGDTGRKARDFCKKIGVAPTVSALARARFVRAAASLPMSNIDFGYRLFRLDQSTVKQWRGDATTLSADLFSAVDNIEESSKDEDVLFEILLKFGLDLTTRVEERRVVGRRVFVIGAGAVVVCIDRTIDVDVAVGIAAIRAELNPGAMRVVFLDSGFPDDVVKTNVVHTLKQAGIDNVRSI